MGRACDLLIRQFTTGLEDGVRALGVGNEPLWNHIRKRESATVRDFFAESGEFRKILVLLLLFVLVPSDGPPSSPLSQDRASLLRCALSRPQPPLETRGDASSVECPAPADIRPQP